MPNTTNYQRNANQPKLQWGITSQWSEWPSSKNPQTINDGEGVEKREPFVHCWWECKLVQTLWKIVWKLLKKLKTEPPHNLAIPLQGIDPMKTTRPLEKDMCTPMFRGALFTISNI